jgi:hypothetical protein
VIFPMPLDIVKPFLEIIDSATAKTNGAGVRPRDAAPDSPRVVS